MEPKSASMMDASTGLAVATPEEIRHDYQAYQVLHWAFVAAPLIAGVDKFFYFLADWQVYLSAPFTNFAEARTFMYVVGLVEITVAVGVALKPRFFAPVVAVWLWAIIINLLMLGNYFDIALRDLGLSLGALALWRLAQHFDHGRHAVDIEDRPRRSIPLA